MHLLSVQEISKRASVDMCILITTLYCKSIYMQLNEYEADLYR